MMMIRASTNMAMAIALLLLTSISAYTTSQDLRQLSRQKTWNMPPSAPSQSPEHVTKKLLKTSGKDPERRGAGWKLSQAAVNSVDHTFAPRTTRASSSPNLAHGLLSPETVSRMDEITAGGYGNEAVRSFLQTYRRKGPMSCLEMLSDPEVLPHLTQAMRDIA
jgi:hypothetical protein